MFGAAIASIELPGNPRVSALAVTSESSSDGCRGYGIDVVDVVNGKFLWPSALDVVRCNGDVGGRDVWMLPLAPAVVDRKQREKGFLASTLVVCVRNDAASVVLCWVDCAKHELTRRMTCECIPYRTNGQPMWQVGDVDSDGVDDIALMGEDRVFVHSAITGARLLEIALPKRASWAPPWSACRGADYDGDGVPDVLIGRPAGDDVWSDGDLCAFSSKTGKLLKRCTVAERGAGFGSSLLARGTGPDQIVLVGKFAFLEDGVDILFAKSLEQIGSKPGARGNYPDIGARLFEAAGYDGDGFVDLLVSRYDCKSPSEYVSGVILYSGKDYSLLGRIELGSLRGAIR
jgi:hypothetical protein